MFRVKQLIIRDCPISTASQDSYITLIKNSNLELLDISSVKVNRAFFEKVVNVVAQRDAVVELVVSVAMYRTALELCEMCPFVKITSRH